MNQKTDPLEAFHQTLLDVVSFLITLDPLVDTPAGRLLDGLADAIETYEIEVYGNMGV